MAAYCNIPFTEPIEATTRVYPTQYFSKKHIAISIQKQAHGGVIAIYWISLLMRQVSLHSCYS